MKKLRKSFLLFLMSALISFGGIQAETTAADSLITKITQLHSTLPLVINEACNSENIRTTINETLTKIKNDIVNIELTSQALNQVNDLIGKIKEIDKDTQLFTNLIQEMQEAVKNKVSGSKAAQPAKNWHIPFFGKDTAEKQPDIKYKLTEIKKTTPDAQSAPKKAKKTTPADKLAQEIATAKKTPEEAKKSTPAQDAPVVTSAPTTVVVAEPAQITQATVAESTQETTAEDKETTAAKLAQKTAAAAPEPEAEPAKAEPEAEPAKAKAEAKEAKEAKEAIIELSGRMYKPFSPTNIDKLKLIAKVLPSIIDQATYNYRICIISAFLDKLNGRIYHATDSNFESLLCVISIFQIANKSGSFNGTEWIPLKIAYFTDLLNKRIPVEQTPVEQTPVQQTQIYSLPDDIKQTLPIVLDIATSPHTSERTQQGTIDALAKLAGSIKTTKLTTTELKLINNRIQETLKNVPNDTPYFEALQVMQNAVDTKISASKAAQPAKSWHIPFLGHTTKPIEPKATAPVVEPAPVVVEQSSSKEETKVAESTQDTTTDTVTAKKAKVTIQPATPEEAKTALDQAKKSGSIMSFFKSKLHLPKSKIGKIVLGGVTIGLIVGGYIILVHNGVISDYVGDCAKHCGSVAFDGAKHYGSTALDGAKHYGSASYEYIKSIFNKPNSNTFTLDLPEQCEPIEFNLDNLQSEAKFSAVKAAVDPATQCYTNANVTQEIIDFNHGQCPWPAGIDAVVKATADAVVKATADAAATPKGYMSYPNIGLRGAIHRKLGLGL